MAITADEFLIVLAAFYGIPVIGLCIMVWAMIKIED